MTADTLDELHEMAKRIGMKPEWFQNGRIPHYDLTLKRRRAAIRVGAIYIPASKQARERLIREGRIKAGAGEFDNADQET